MAAAFPFAVPSAVPQDLQLIQDIVGQIPPPTAKNPSDYSTYSDHDHGTDSETDSEQEVEADILGGAEAKAAPVTDRCAALFSVFSLS